MPRLSAAARALPVAVRSNPPLLEAPRGMPARELAVWRRTVESLPGDWFRPEQVPIVTQFCRLTVLADRLAKLIAECDPDDLDRYGKLLRLTGELSGRILACARSMRITPQSRIHVETAGRHAANAPPARDDNFAIAYLIKQGRERNAKP